MSRPSQVSHILIPAVRGVAKTRRAFNRNPSGPESELKTQMFVERSWFHGESPQLVPERKSLFDVGTSVRHAQLLHGTFWTYCSCFYCGLFVLRLQFHVQTKSGEGVWQSTCQTPYGRRFRQKAVEGEQTCYSAHRGKVCRRFEFGPNPLSRSVCVWWFHSCFTPHGPHTISIHHWLTSNQWSISSFTVSSYQTMWRWCGSQINAEQLSCLSLLSSFNTISS